MDSKTRPFDVIGQLGALRRYARSLVRHADDAEDLVQDALLRAYERRGTFERGGNIGGWLMSILHNSHIDRVRSARSSQRRHDQAAEIAETVLAANQEHAVRLRQVREAFFELPDEQREALHLVAIEDLSYQEAATTLGIPVGTLMSRVSRARERLRAFEDRPASLEPRLRLIGRSGHDDP